MQRDDQMPVFCDHCSMLCLAELDGELLCAECLMAALASLGEYGAIGRIVSLEALRVAGGPPPAS